ncbi:TlyA family RNA methyltransferase [Alicyclobacillus sp.]|uniref:TlyA family RNA methyltransferase n=1 Tax=Alicyclobacillus sp. TaxID=61169 RepID=UPI0025B7D42D|nr:TlyA family RNA methyltransferase [Alicyclobacillus sp.]MCL6517788.1 TlyA family RNA methyltransferase [Alicyclobacillus sp.]
MSQKKVRLDVLLHQRGLFPSREAARRAIMAGLVRRAGERVDKPGTQVAPDETFEVAGPEHPYVGRGGLKLERALEVFDVSLADRVVVDVGASTGGFTDCALRHGARLVYAVDVGYGQLAWSLRQDPRVVVMERTNFRHVDPERFQPRPSVAVMDVSFISIRLLFEKLREVLEADGWVISLVKPQFEAGREAVGKGGIVRDPSVHERVLFDVVRAARDAGMTCVGLDHSPITGGDGNIEFLACWRLGPHGGSEAVSERIPEVVRAAWRAFGRGPDASGGARA